MRALQDALDGGIQAVTNLRSALARKRGQRQVRSSDERSIVKATAEAWFHNLKPKIVEAVPAASLEPVDGGFSKLAEWADQNTTRNRYFEVLGTLKADLVALRTAVLRAPPAPRNSAMAEAAPDFGAIASDPQMQAILTRRWEEIGACVRGGANLAATVMMGGLLEGLLLSRVLRLPDKDRAQIFRTKACPKRKDGTARPLSEWTLHDYIAVAYGMAWIGDTAKAIGGVVRDYRNFVHPQKEYSQGVAITAQDARIHWAVCSTLTREIIASTS